MNFLPNMFGNQNNGNYGGGYGYPVGPTIIQETADSILAKNEPLQYLKSLERKLEYDHEENMNKIKSNHITMMNKIQEDADGHLGSVAGSLTDTYFRVAGSEKIGRYNGFQIDIIDENGFFSGKKRGYRMKFL